MNQPKSPLSRAPDESACSLLLGFSVLFFSGLLAVMLFLPLKAVLMGSDSVDHGDVADDAHLASDTSEAIAPASAGQTAYAICASCHGAEGQGNAMMHAPALAGQEDWYLKRQINKFKDGQRGTHADDLYGMQMRPMAMMLQDDAQIDTVVGYIASLPAAHSELTLGGDAAKGEASYMMCLACHGADAEGNAAMNAPSLIGLPDWYIVSQLKNYKAGVRGTDPKDIEGMMMRPMAMTIPDEATMNNIAAFIHSKSTPVEAEDAGSTDAQHPGQAGYMVCSSCHGAEGQGNAALHAPALAGQEDWYLKRQINKFKGGQRGTHADDTYGAQMRPMAQMLQDDAQIDAVVGYIAQLPMAQSELTLGGDAAKGAAGYMLCQACHGAGAEGNAVMNAPGLKGLPDWYIVSQLENFKAGVRGADPKDLEGMQMRPMASMIANADAMRDIAAYIHSKGSSAEATEAAAPVAAAKPLNADELIALGNETFDTMCVACHQSEGVGQVGFAPSISNRDFLAAASDEFIRKTIRVGRPGTSMVAWSMLSDQQVDGIIAYLRSFPVALPVEVTVDPDKIYPGDAIRGQETFDLFCAYCHGEAGIGYAAGSSGPGIGLAGFLEVASDDFIMQTAKHGRVGTAMKSMVGAKGVANLTESDIGDVIAYLRSGDATVDAQQTGARSPHADPINGELQYKINCAACHQEGGTGKMGFAPSIRNRDFLAIASDDFIRDTIQKGRAGTAMVARPDLSEAVVGDIIAYLRALPVKNPISVDLDPDKVVQGDVIAGGEKFEIFCATCHGEKGEGYASGGPGPGIGLAGFLNTASDDYILQTVKLGRTGTSMRSFIGAEGVANLEEQDVNDIIVFLRSLND